MRNNLPYDKISVSLPQESLAQLELIAEAESLPADCSRSTKIRVAIQIAYEQKMYERVFFSGAASGAGK